MARSQRRGFAVKEEKRAEALVRVTNWRTLSAAQQLASLDARLGKGAGARRQRAKLGAS